MITFLTPFTSSAAESVYQLTGITSPKVKPAEKQGSDFSHPGVRLSLLQIQTFNHVLTSCHHVQLVQLSRQHHQLVVVCL